DLVLVPGGLLAPTLGAGERERKTLFAGLLVNEHRQREHVVARSDVVEGVLEQLFLVVQRNSSQAAKRPAPGGADRLTECQPSPRRAATEEPTAGRLPDDEQRPAVMFSPGYRLAEKPAQVPSNRVLRLLRHHTVTGQLQLLID